MSWILDWHPAAIHTLQSLPLWTQARLDAAIIQYADTGRGTVRQLAPPDPRRLVITVRDAGAVLYLDRETRTMTVAWVFRRE